MHHDIDAMGFFCNSMQALRALSELVSASWEPVNILVAARGRPFCCARTCRPTRCVIGSLAQEMNSTTVKRILMHCAAKPVPHESIGVLGYDCELTQYSRSKMI